MQKAKLLIATGILAVSTGAASAQNYPPTTGDFPQGAPAYGQAFPVQTQPERSGFALVAGPKPVTKGAPGAPKTMSVGQWFAAYDSVRRQAQMAPAEKQRADAIMSKGMAMMMPGEDKVAAKTMLTGMVGRYQKASAQLKQIPQLQQTANLHMLYYQYFTTAGNLFADYIRVQDNLFQTDASGQPLAASLLQRKQALEALEAQCKQVDATTRAQFNIAPYRYQ